MEDSNTSEPSDKPTEQANATVQQTATTGQATIEQSTIEQATIEEELSIAEVVGITAATTLLITLPVGVLLGCCWRCCLAGLAGGWCSNCFRKKKPREQGAMYKEPYFSEKAIPLSDIMKCAKDSNSI